ncbi:hydrolase TatD [candidate division WOR-1 bacterium RIFOXYB2_FULL_48_7]|uniref:Hydrolase TatD n=1 Tax=candidate division WOR-1 bacterium RIFOXYB2_FULL_48_7 TaxID=1802583 RepID=A0A1F4TRK8_UNCSA|nr:MAG: hydrolase TatD [candidate division WOR-1 bacterium RIFOXYB2_FULL_48_7]
MLIDTHAHLTFPEFTADLPEIIARAKAAQLEAIINIALDNEAINQSFKLAEEYPGYLYTALGLHPHEASQWRDTDYQRFQQLATRHKIVALGEMGLDYHYKLSPLEQQKKVFRKFLQLAQEVDLPAVIHSRDAAQDTLDILREENQGKLRGVLHCFAGDMKLGQAALDMGLYISFTANITYPKADNLRQAVKSIPIDRLLIETDCPFLAPQIYRGSRNEPAYVIKVAEKIAEVKGLSYEEVALQTTANAKHLFQI